MLKLEVKEYCQNCPDFEADVIKNTGYSINGETGIIYSNTIIRCEHCSMCEQLHDYIKRNEVNKNASNTYTTDTKPD